MDAALAGLLGASIGGVAGILGGFIAGWQQQKAEVRGNLSDPWCPLICSTTGSMPSSVPSNCTGYSAR